MKQKTHTMKVTPTQMHLIVQVPNEERSLCVAPGTVIATDTHTFVCTESPTPPHCTGCGATRELCRIMNCMPFDRQDRKYVQFRCVSDE